MAEPTILILNSGGLRSLVATALLASQAHQHRMTLLHMVDGRPTAAARLKHMHLQAEQLGIKKAIEIDMSHLFDKTQKAAVPLSAPQLLLAALSKARLIGAEQVVWPISCAGDAKAAALATEQAMLCEQLALVEGADQLRVEMPLLEMAGRQVIELGGQLQVPWRLAWSCELPGEEPCRACSSCRRRRGAFDAAGMADPAEAAITR